MPDEPARRIPPPPRTAREGVRRSRRTTVVELEAQMKIGPAMANPVWIRETILQCKRDLDLARVALEQQNLKGAVVNSYDAARNAIECHMNANGPARH